MWSKIVYVSAHHKFIWNHTRNGEKPTLIIYFAFKKSSDAIRFKQELLHDLPYYVHIKLL